MFMEQSNLIWSGKNSTYFELKYELALIDVNFMDLLKNILATQLFVYWSEINSNVM